MSAPEYVAHVVSFWSLSAARQIAIGFAALVIIGAVIVVSLPHQLATPPELSSQTSRPLTLEAWRVRGARAPMSHRPIPASCPAAIASWREVPQTDGEEPQDAPSAAYPSQCVGPSRLRDRLAGGVTFLAIMTSVLLLRRPRSANAERYRPVHVDAPVGAGG